MIEGLIGSTITKWAIVILVCTVIIIPCIAAMPAITISASSVISSTFYSYVRAGLYFLPAGTIASICGLQIAFWIFRIVIAVIHSVWALLPFTG